MLLAGIALTGADRLVERVVAGRAEGLQIARAEAADRIFDILMGTDVASRKSFIQSNAKLATVDL